MKLRRLSVNLVVLTISVIITMLLCEGTSRIVLHPADYLSVEMIPDDVLGFVPSKNTGAGGFDAWGFRNPEVPKAADIVAIGDSHTYGNTARMADSWPFVLGRLTGRSVYNMGLGGYGPNQYDELLKNRALSLKPRLVICGFYMGDDFENAFLITYGLDHWSYLREIPAEKVDVYRSQIWDPPPTQSWHKKIRVWLSRHSVVYQVAFHASPLGHLKGDVQIKNASGLYNSATSLSVPEKKILEAFRPVNILRDLDQESASVREGMRITFKLLKEMNEVCHRNNIEFLVAVIPTKEMVFSDYLQETSNPALKDTLDKLVMNEKRARGEMFKFFADSNISYVDALPALKASVERGLYARSAEDMHPNKNGYRVIAEAVYGALSPNDKSGRRGSQLLLDSAFGQEKFPATRASTPQPK